MLIINKRRTEIWREIDFCPPLAMEKTTNSAKVLNYIYKMRMVELRRCNDYKGILAKVGDRISGRFKHGRR